MDEKEEESLWFEFDEKERSYAVFGIGRLSSSLSLPDAYDDETNGRHPLTSIGEHAFSGSDLLESIYIPSSVTHIGEKAFSGIPSLKEIRYGGTPSMWASLKIKGFDSGLRGKGVSLCFEGVPAKEIELEGIEEVRSYAFSECLSLEKVKVSFPVTSIGEGAFKECTSLGEVMFPDSLESVGAYAFASCTSLVCISLPKGVKSIEESAFENCTSLKRISLPSSLESMGEYAFKDCISLESISIPQGMESIEESAFENCTSLKSVSVPDTLECIGTNAFKNCVSLERITIPESVKRMGLNVFGGCSSLKEINCENGLICLDTQNGFVFMKNQRGTYSLLSCVSSDVTDVTVPERVDSLPVTGIMSDAFNKCTSLVSIVIPESITVISDPAFSGCSSLKHVFYEGSSSSSLSCYRLEYGTVYSYREEQPERKGNYWHYVNGVPSIW